MAEYVISLVEFFFRKLANEICLNRNSIVEYAPLKFFTRESHKKRSNLHQKICDKNKCTFSRFYWVSAHLNCALQADWPTNRSKRNFFFSLPHFFWQFHKTTWHARRQFECEETSKMATINEPLTFVEKWLLRQKLFVFPCIDYMQNWLFLFHHKKIKWLSIKRHFVSISMIFMSQ